MVYYLFYPLIFYVDDHQQEKREEIRVGKAMVDKKKQGDEAIDDKPRDKRRKGKRIRRQKTIETNKEREK